MKKGLFIAIIAAVALFASCASTGGAPKEPVSYKLLAKDAVLETTGNLVLENNGDAPNVGYWESTEDKVKWEVTVEYDCNYQVIFRASCDPQFPGSVVNITVGDQVATVTIPDTGAWQTYKNIDAGIVSLKKGTFPVVVQAASVDNRFVCNLQLVKLTTVAE